MGRLFVTNELISTSKFINKAEKQGFTLNRSIIENNTTVVTFFKKKIRVDNVFKTEKGFCVCSGSLIYKDSCGSVALESIYNDFEGDVASIRTKILGNYCIGIKKGDKFIVFVDKYHTYSLYYRYINEKYYMSSDLQGLLEVQTDWEISEFGLLQQAFQCAPIGNETFIKDVYRLEGYEFIEIDTKNESFSVKRIKYSRVKTNYKSSEEASEIISEKIAENFKLIHKVYGENIAINQTGGLDSRTVLAACLNAGIKPKLLNAQSISPIVGTEYGDYQCVKELSERYKLELIKMNWDCNFPDDFKNWNNLFEKYGFDYIFYGGNRNFHDMYENLPGEYPVFMETGLFGEALRIRDVYNDRTDSFRTVNEFIQEYQLKGTNSKYISNEGFCLRSAELQQYMLDKYKKILNIYNFDFEHGISLDAFEEVRFMQARRSDGTLINYLNQYTNCISVLSTEQVCEYIYDLPKAYRAYGQFQLRVIGKLSPDLLLVPFFSHCTDCTFDRENYILKPNMHFNEKIGKCLRSSGLRNTLLYEVMRQFKNYILRNDWKVNRGNACRSASNVVVPELCKYIMNDEKTIGSFVDIQKIPKYDSLIHLIYYSMYLHGCKILKDRE